jgi:hypothetical protein
MLPLVPKKCIPSKKQLEEPGFSRICNLSIYEYKLVIDSRGCSFFFLDQDQIIGIPETVFHGLKAGNVYL